MRRESVKIKQQGRFDCGAACLASIAANFGLYVPSTRIRILSGTDSNGSSIRGLAEAAQKLGFEAEGFKGGSGSLDKIPKPAILHLRKEDGYLHFVVLYKCLKNNFLIMDPSVGDLEKVTRVKLLSEWSGYLILVLPGKRLEKSKASPVCSFLYSVIKQNFKAIFTNIVLSILYIVSSLSIVIFIKYLFDSIIPSGEYHRIEKYIRILLPVIFFSITISFFRALLCVKMSVKIDNVLTSSYIKHLFEISLPFFNSFKTGEITSRMSDIYKIRKILTEIIPESLIALLTLMISISILIFFNYNLAVMSLFFIPIYFIVFVIYDKVNKRLSRESAEKASVFHSNIFESVKSIATIKNFCYEREITARTSVRLNQLSETLHNAGRKGVIAGSTVEVVSKSLLVFVLSYGGASVISGGITIGELVSFYTLTTLFTSPVQQLASLLPTLREGGISAKRYLDITMIGEEKSSGCIHSCKPDLLAKPAERLFCVEVKNISFSYPGRDRLFCGISFKIERGEIVRVKGESGCGKSTLASLLMLHNKADSGSILADGIDINSFPPDLWRGMVSVVPQEPDIFGDTILECITGITPPAERIAGAHLLCSELKLDKTLNGLPNGILSHPGECGRMLSRGEKQRIAFARAVLRSPSLLILDEATSSLDTESAAVIENMVERMKNSGMMILFISHNEHSSLVADRSVYIKRA